MICEYVDMPARDSDDGPERCGQEAVTEGAGQPLCAEHADEDGRGWE